MAKNERDLVNSDPTLAARFWQKVNKRGPDECWNWTAGQRAGRYGNIRVGGKRGPMVASHRIQAIWQGHDTDDRVVMHTCDNGLCVNPAHLVTASQADNVLDMIEKGRGRQPKGEDQGRAGLLNAQVAEIRRRLAERQEPADIGRAMGIAHLTIYNIATMRLYASVAREIEHPLPSRNGIRNSQAKLTAEQVAEARRLYTEHQSYAEVGRLMQLSDAIVRRVVRGDRYSTETDVAPIPTRTGPVRQIGKRTLTEDQARIIKAELFAGTGTFVEIAKRHGISLPLTAAIKSGRAYGWVHLTEDVAHE